LVQLTCDNVLLICLQFAKMALVRIGESLREVGRSLETYYVCVSAFVYVEHASAVNSRQLILPSVLQITVVLFNYD